MAVSAFHDMLAVLPTLPRPTLEHLFEPEPTYYLGQDIGRAREPKGRPGSEPVPVPGSGLGTIWDLCFLGHGSGSVRPPLQRGGDADDTGREELQLAVIAHRCVAVRGWGVHEGEAWLGSWGQGRDWSTPARSRGL